MRTPYERRASKLFLGGQTKGDSADCALEEPGNRLCCVSKRFSSDARLIHTRHTVYSPGPPPEPTRSRNIVSTVYGCELVK